MKIWMPVLMIAALCVATTSLAEGYNSDPEDTDPESAAISEAYDLVEAGYHVAALARLGALASDYPGNADVQNLLGYTHRKLGNLDQSGVHYDRALDLDPDHLGALEYQGELFLMLGALDKARENLARLDALCAETCEERDMLEAAISDWQAGQ